MRQIPSCQLPHRVTVERKTGQSSFGELTGKVENVPCWFEPKKTFSRLTGTVLYDAVLFTNLELAEQDKVVYNLISYQVFTVHPMLLANGKVFGYRVELKR